MSRIGKMPITVGKGVTIDISATNWVVVKGPLGEMGLQVDPDMSLNLEDGTLTVEAIGGEIPGATLDLRAAGELAPTIVALGALASAPVEVTGIGHIRGHETDRIRALVDDIVAIGGAATALPDGIRVEPAPLTGGPWGAYADHRIATAGAVIGLRVPGVEIDDIGATAKTIPEFPELWAAMLA